MGVRKPEVIDGVLWGPKRWVSPGVVGDGFEPVDPDSEEYAEVLLESGALERPIVSDEEAR